MTISPHLTDPLSACEIRLAARIARETVPPPHRFNSITLTEPTPDTKQRSATVLVINPPSATTHELRISLPDGKVEYQGTLKVNVQPSLTTDDCFLAEAIIKADENVRQILQTKYNLSNVEDQLMCDPWSVHIPTPDYELAKCNEEGKVPRLLQMFLYMRLNEFDNHYAHPIDVYPVVDLHSERIVELKGGESGKIPQAAVNYHPTLLPQNKFLNRFREDQPKPLHITQPEGASFRVKGRHVEWQKWNMRVCFNGREGLVLRDISYDGRPICRRASLVEMAVPYADPNAPFTRKCAFDIGDYGLGVCAVSLALGCDCVGNIYYFDEVINDSKGEAMTIKNAICMHEEDAGILYKHVEYRNGMSQSRRNRVLVISFVATVVNYEYLFYWRFGLDGSWGLKVQLSGELSTNQLSRNEVEPEHGVLVAEGVNAQIHQHMFCARLEMTVDGTENRISEIDFVKADMTTPAGNAFGVKETQLKTEKEARREGAIGRTWRIYNPTLRNPVNGKHPGYKLIPHAFGACMPSLLTADESAVTKRGRFATKMLWVTKYTEGQDYPAGRFPLQGDGKGVWEWGERNAELNERLVLWHSFGVSHVPRAEDFPIMPCEDTGFMLKADNFWQGNPGIDLAEEGKELNASKACNGQECNGGA